MITSSHFPTTIEQAIEWRPIIYRRALAAKVLAVATTRIEGAWKAYCDAVPGRDHDVEWQQVLDRGCALQERHALAIFPEFEGVRYAR
jgi:hypothetical protein